MNEKAGAIALVGSGEYLPQMQELESLLLHLAISAGKNNSYVQIPTGAGKEGADRLEYWKKRGEDQALRIGAECIYLPILNREDAFNVEYIELILKS